LAEDHRTQREHPELIPPKTRGRLTGPVEAPGGKKEGPPFKSRSKHEKPEHSKRLPRSKSQPQGNIFGPPLAKGGPMHVHGPATPGDERGFVDEADKAAQTYHKSKSVPDAGGAFDFGALRGKRNPPAHVRLSGHKDRTQRR